MATPQQKLIRDGDYMTEKTTQQPLGVASDLNAELDACETLTFKFDNGELSSVYEKRPLCLFIQDRDRKKGFFHVIGFDDRLGRRKGFIIERSNKGTYAIHLILSFTGFKKRQFKFCFGENCITDYPMYWCRITWRTTLWWKMAGFKRFFGTLEARCGVNAESVR